MEERHAFVRRGACRKAGKIDGERGYRKVNQGSTEMMSTEHASVTKWRRGKERSRERERGKERFMERGN